MLKVKELRDQSPEELQALSIDLSREIFELRNELKTTRKLEKPHLIQIIKKDRARALTILRQKKAQL